MSSSNRPRYRGRHGNRGPRRSEPPADEQSAETSSGLDENSPVVQMFRRFAADLDRKHDRYERLVKKSRDVTIESKRIIFMLHRVTSDGKSQEILDEAAGRFTALESTILRQIAEELDGQDPYLFMRAISPGLQEYIEALSFYFYLLQERLISWSEVQSRLRYADTQAQTADEHNLTATAAAGAGETTGEVNKCIAPGQPAAAHNAEVNVDADATRESDAADSDRTPLPPADAHNQVAGTAVGTREETGQDSCVTLPADKSCHQQDSPETKEAHTSPELKLELALPYHEYVLGVADLTGELMRRCISSVSAGQLDQCWKLCSFLRSIHEGFIGIGNTGPREVGRKLYTLRQSLGKVENACYQLRVRGEEIPKHMLADVFSCGADEFQPAGEEYGTE